ncbi:Peptidyl-tRNA hydrolase ICT1, mitochondrial [Bulinus truncatus]|nr:Peptidyl-tRNA hydrolase ICT1, mitochondrial [Bulinus truncatus]
MLPIRTFAVRQQLKHVLQGRSYLKVLNASFRSHLSYDKLYPDSNPDFLRNSNNSGLAQKGHETSDKAKEQFNGYIPIDSLEISSCRSSGPGGQGVNTTNSKVEVRFHLQSASWIPEWVKPKLLDQEHGRVNKEGYLVVRSDMTRKQLINQADCMNKIRQMIYAASVVPKQATKEEIELHKKRKAKIKAENSKILSIYFYFKKRIRFQLLLLKFKI